MICRIEDGFTYLQTYNVENRIASIAKLAVEDCTPLEEDDYLTKWDFAYDGDGVRTSTFTTPYEDGDPQSPLLTVYYFGGSYEVNGEGEIDNDIFVFTSVSSEKKYYSFGGQTIMRDENDQLQYFLTDHLGSNVVITDDEGTLISQQRYLPFGGVRSDMGSISQQTDYGYTNQRDLDSAMGGLMDYKARFYSPVLGRFIQPDTIIPGAENPQAWNRFSYVKNNPTSFNDPSGHDPITFFALLVIGSVILSACATAPTEAPTVTPTVSAEERLQQINTIADKYNITLPKGTTWGYRDVSELLPYANATDIMAGHSSWVTETIPLDFKAYDDKVYITNLGFDPDYYIDEIETVGLMEHESTHA
jgi:RHS repeat-associated protein